MAGMTPTQVEQIVNQQQASDQHDPNSDLDPNGNPSTVPGTDGNWYSPQEIFDAQIAFGQNQATPDQLRMLQSIDPLDGGITDTQARTYNRQSAKSDKPMVYHAPTKTRAAYYTDPDTGTAYDVNGNILAQALDENAPPYYLALPNQQYAPGTAPPGAAPQPGARTTVGTGVDHYATDVQAQIELANLEEKKREFGLTFPEQQREFDLQHQLATQTEQASVLQNRANTGLNVGQFAQSLANDQFKRAEDPGNFPAYLAASAGLPRGSGSPIDQLLGNGVQIAQPEGGNPLADPRFKNLMDQLYGYAQPQNISTVQNIAANNGGTLPQSFYDYTGTQAPAHAQGGSQMLHEPVIAIGMHTGRPAFIAGEAGDERVDFTPAVHSHSDGGQPIPHSHDRGDQKHEHMDANSPATYADGGTAQIQPYDSSTNDPMQGQTQYPTGTQKALPTSTTPTAAGPASGLTGPIGGGGLAGSTSPVWSAANGTYSWDQPDPNMQRVSDAYARDPAAAQRFFSQSPSNLQQMFGTSPAGSTGQSNPQDFWNQYGGYTADQKARLQSIAQNGGLTPAQGTNIALGKGLQALGWVNNNLVQHLLTGDSPTPGMIDDQTLMRLPPSYRALLQAAIRAQVGSAGLGDYAQSQQDFAMPGLGSSYPTASYA